MKTILQKVNAEYDKLTIQGRKPNALFMSTEGRERFAKQAAAAYGVSEQEVSKKFMGMEIYVASQYREDNFRIYCEPVFEGET